MVPSPVPPERPIEPLVVAGAVVAGRVVGAVTTIGFETVKTSSSANASKHKVGDL